MIHLVSPLKQGLHECIDRSYISSAKFGNWSCLQILRLSKAMSFPNGEQSILTRTRFKFKTYDFMGDRLWSLILGSPSSPALLEGSTQRLAANPSRTRCFEFVAPGHNATNVTDPVPIVLSQTWVNLLGGRNPHWHPFCQYWQRRMWLVVPGEEPGSNPSDAGFESIGFRKKHSHDHDMYIHD